MRKVKPKPFIGSKNKSLVGLNRSVSTYGKNNLRFLEINDDWLEIQASPQHKKGIFSDSDDSIAVSCKTKAVKNITKESKKGKENVASNKKNLFDESNVSIPFAANDDKRNHDYYTDHGTRKVIHSINDTTCHIINSSVAFIALNSSKAKHITKGRRRRKRKSEFKVTDGCLTFSFCEQFHDDVENLPPFQTTIIHGHNDSLSELLHPRNKELDTMKQTQSTPLRLGGNFTPLSVARTKFDAKCFLQNFGTPMSAVRTRQQLQLFRSKTLEQTDQDIFHLSFEEALSPKKFAAEKSLTAREKVLLECDQNSPKSFDVLLAALNPSCKKIGEGVFGEVYQFTAMDRTNIALKVVPIEGDVVLNGERQKTHAEMLPEIVNSLELSELRKSVDSNTSSFITLIRVHLTYGVYPPILLSAWDDYDEQKSSENDRPNLTQDNQFYVAFEFMNGGEDIEHFKFNNAAQALSVVKQTVGGLAVAEHMLKFEHRDLHWGNILVQKSSSKSTSFQLDGKEYKIETQGLTAQVIDFTLSRMTKGGISLYQDLSKDEDLFKGDSSVDYQFEIYRMMRRETDNDWSVFEPKTNVFWIHYLLDKFLNEVKYKNKRTKIHRQSLHTLRHLHGLVLSCSSCRHIVESSSLFTSR